MVATVGQAATAGQVATVAWVKINTWLEMSEVQWYKSKRLGGRLRSQDSLARGSEESEV